MDDPCPLDAGPSPAEPCPTEWAYFFIRILDNDRRTPVMATLALRPSVYRIVTSEDGYAGILRPGAYRLRIEAHGYAPVVMDLVVGPAEKALVEVEMTALELAAPGEDS
jgi:hypothetical protein